MSIKKLVYLITILAVFAMAARFSIDTDTWWHLRSGKWILDHKSVPRTDPFSYTREGESWLYPGWLMEIVIYGVYVIFSAGGLNTFTAIMVSLTFLFLWHTITGNHFLKAFVIVFAATVSGLYWAARPYLITFLFTAIFLFLLERERRGWLGAESPPGENVGSRLWFLPVLMILWVNSHGGFAVGFILYGIYGLGLTSKVGLRNIYRTMETKIQGLWERKSKAAVPEEAKDVPWITSRWNRMVLIGLVMIIAVGINHAGPRMLMYPFQTVGIEALSQYIEEWQSPDFHELRVQPFLLLLMLTFGAVGASKQQLSLEDFLLVSVFGSMSFFAARNISLFALTAPIVLTRYGVPLAKVFGEDAKWLKEDQRKVKNQSWMNAVHWAVLLTLLASVAYKVSLIYPPQRNEAYFSDTFPVEAVDFIQKREFPGRLFNSYNWGGYLIWALPDYPVFVDGRTDLFGDEIIDQWVTVVQGDEGWQEIIRRWDINLILLEPYRPVVKELPSAGWKLEYESSQAVIYTNREREE